MLVRSEVVLPGVKGTNLSRPDAKAGDAILREAQKRLQAGEEPKQVLAALSIKWGVKEVIEAIAFAMGQANFKRAVEQGQLYRLN